MVFLRKKTKPNRHRLHLNCHTQICALALAAAARGRSAVAARAGGAPRWRPRERWVQPRSSEQAREMETLERESTFVPNAVKVFHRQ